MSLSLKALSPLHLLNLVALLVFSLLSPRAALCQPPAYAEELVQKADALQLHEERQWKVLLHYAQGYLGPPRSRIGDDRFFLSPAGRTDSRAELEATLRSFFVPAPDGEHSACRFPARYQWLSFRLNLEPERLPPFTCTERDRTFELVDPRSAVLVFPVGHINSPASMFGHTLLRIDSRSKSSLISYAANYAAHTTDTNGFLYAYRGLFGKYRGYFSLMPYYQKVKEYNDLEHRDMWEYSLNLSEDEVRMMLNHLWELQTIYSPYFFLDENCSYNLLFLVEAARPQLHLTDRTGLFVLPTDTIRVARKSGVLGEVRYRPSRGTRIRHMLSFLPEEQRSYAHRLALASYGTQQLQSSGLTDAEKMRILDLAAEYVQYRLGRRELELSDYSKLYRSILIERSRLGAAPAEARGIAEPAHPEKGHRTGKVALGLGVRRGEPLVELSWRPAFHNLLDPDQGYLKGAQIEFFSTVVNYNAKRQSLELRKMHGIDIVSLAPRDIFFTPLSWKVLAGVDREPMGDGRDAAVYRLNSGGGLAYSSPLGGILYAMGELDLAAGAKIRAGVTLAPGLSVGWLEQLTEWWKLHLEGRAFLYRLGDRRDRLRLAVAQNFRVSRDNSITLEYAREHVNGQVIEEGAARWNLYY